MFKVIGKIARQFKEFRGKKRICRVLLAPFIASAKDIQINGHYDCTYLLPNIQESLAFELFVNGIYEMETNRFLLTVLPKNAVYIDIGANIGSVAIPLCKRRPDIRCFAVEASDWVYKYLVTNIKQNKLEQSVTCINEAMADTAEGYVSFYTNERVFGKGSLSPVFSNEPVQVKRTCFEQLMQQYNLSRVDVIKIDIEGFEYFAFKGGDRLLNSADAPLILFEFVSWAEKHAGIEPGEAQRLLKSWGYSLYQLNLDGTLKLQETILEEGGATLVASKKTLLT